MNGAEIELDTLTNTDGAGTENQNFFLSAGLYCFVLTAEYGIVVRGLSLELCRTGIYHFISGYDTVFITKILDLPLTLSGEAGDDIVRELQSLGFF